MSRKLLFAFLLLLQSAMAFAQLGVVYKVKVNGDDNADGQSWPTAFATVQKALSVAQSGAQIWVAKGTYKPTVAVDANGDGVVAIREKTFQLVSGVQLYGGFAGNEDPATFTLDQRNVAANETILSGDLDGSNSLNANDANHILFCTGAGTTAVLNGFTITGGNASLDNFLGIPGTSRFYSWVGAGLLVRDGAHVTIGQCQFTNNFSFAGGALYNDATTIISRSHFSVNSGGTGAALRAGGKTTIHLCTFIGNTSNGYGGAVANGSDGEINIVDSRFENNQTSQGTGGGAVYLGLPRTPLASKISGCLFLNNKVVGSSGAGGGLLSEDENLLIVNCRFEGNEAFYGGGAAFNINPLNSYKAELKNCTFFRNRASASGGGVYNLGGSPLNAFNCTFVENDAILRLGVGTGLLMYNCIMWNNQAPQFPNQGIFLGYNLAEGLNPGGTNLDGTNPANNPLFVDQANGDLRLQPCSPLLNRGDNTVNSQPTDIAGNPRIFNAANGGVIDLGAYEYQDDASTDITLFVNAAAAPGGTGYSWSTAFTNLQSALSLARNCSRVKQIWVAKGTYKPTVASDVNNDGVFEDREKTFELVDGVQLYGGFAGNEDPATFNLDQRNVAANETILSGDLDGSNSITDNDAYHVVYSNGTVKTTAINGFTITGGNAITRILGFNFAGGGILLVNDTDVIIAHCSITGNSGNTGGGIFNEAATVTITQSRFIKNNARNGGGLENRGIAMINNCDFDENSSFRTGGAINNLGKITITNSRFSNNRQGDSDYGGGAIYSSNGTLVLNNCQLINNYAEGDGGAIYIDANNFFLINNCRFQGNETASRGGAIYLVGARNSNSGLTNCIFFRNKAMRRGGAVSNNSSSGPLPTYNCTFVENSAGEQVGSSFNLRYFNCIDWNNSAPEFPNNPQATLYSLVEGRNPGGTNLDGTNPANNPLFVDQANGDLRLQPCSPLLNRGDNTVNSHPTDIAGNPRIFNAANGGVIDLGAYEYQDEFDAGPVVTQPQNIQQNTDAGQCGTNISFTPLATGCGTVTTASYLNYGTPQQQSITFPHFFEKGMYEVTVQATDILNRKATSTFSVTVADNEPPVIECPPAINVSCVEAGDEPGQATATDNCGNVAITFTDVSTRGSDPSQFDYWNYTITRTWKATDNANLSSTCVQTITVANNNYTWYRDADGDGFGEAGAVVYNCTTPKSHGVNYVRNNTDCNDNDANIWRTAILYVDADGDSYTVGNGEMVCYGATVPPGYTSTKSAIDDCNDNDATKWRTATLFVDADGDGYTVGNGEVVCYGANIPQGYTSTKSSIDDCNDNDATKWQSAILYVDADGDGYTVGNGVIVCYGANIPAGYKASRSAITDCNDNNPQLFEVKTWYQDKDGDGYAGQVLQSCGRPAGSGWGTNVLPGGDCNDDDEEINPDTPWYRDADGDGHGNPGIVVYSCTRPAGYVAVDYENSFFDCNDADNNTKKPEDNEVIMCKDGKQECVKVKDVAKKLAEKDGRWSAGPCDLPCKDGRVLWCHNGHYHCLKPSEAANKAGKTGWSAGYCATPAARAIVTSSAPNLQMQAYPNPTTGRFSLRLPALQGARAEVSITSAAGSSIVRKAVNANGQPEHFDLRPYGPGVYIVNLLAAGYSRQVKVIVAR